MTDLPPDRVDEEAMDALSGRTVLRYADQTVNATFHDDESVNPHDAAAEISRLITDAGGALIEPFIPEDQNSKADPGFVTADLKVMLPSGKRVWLSIECKADDE